MLNRPDRTVMRNLSTLFEVGVVAGLTDGQLLERFAARGGVGTEAAFAVLVERHGPMVLRVCRRILRDEHAAEDAFQATFLVLARKGGSLWVRDSVGPWLHRVTRRVAIHARAAADRRKASEQRAAEMASERRTGNDRTNELGPVLDEEIDRLPAYYRMPVILCDLEGCSYEQAARHLGCNMGTLKSRLARARERLRGRLIRRGVVPATGGLASVFAIKPAEAAVPVMLMKFTVLAAVRSMATSAATGGVIPPLVVELTEGVLKSMSLNVMIRIGGFVLASGLVMSGVGLLATRASGELPVPSLPSAPQAVAQSREAEARAKASAKAAEASAREASAKEREAKAKGDSVTAREAAAKEREAKAKGDSVTAREASAKEREAKAKGDSVTAREASAKEREAKAKGDSVTAREASAKEREAKAKGDSVTAREAAAKEREAKAKGDSVTAREAAAKEREAKAKGDSVTAREASAKEREAKAKGDSVTAKEAAAKEAEAKAKAAAKK